MICLQPSTLLPSIMLRKNLSAVLSGCVFPTLFANQIFGRDFLFANIREKFCLRGHVCFTVFDPNVNNEVVKPLRDFLPTYMCFIRKFTFFIV